MNSGRVDRRDLPVICEIIFRRDPRAYIMVMWRKEWLAQMLLVGWLLVVTVDIGQ